MKILVNLIEGIIGKKICKNTLCYFRVNFLKRHLNRNGGSINLYKKY